MSSKRSSRAETQNALARLLERGEEAVGVFVEELLSNKTVADQLGKTLGRAMTAKKRVDKNMQTMLSLLNVPSKADLHRLQHKVEALQGSVVNISMKLDRVLAAQHEHAAAAHHAPAVHAAKPAAHTRARKTRKRSAS